MDIDRSLDIVKQALESVIKGKEDINESSNLFGRESLLDSMGLVELCLALEDAADENDFEFDWTSEEAFSKTRGMFRSVLSLAEEFAKQSEREH